MQTSEFGNDCLPADIQSAHKGGQQQTTTTPHTMKQKDALVTVRVLLHTNCHESSPSILWIGPFGEHGNLTEGKVRRDRLNVPANTLT